MPTMSSVTSVLKTGAAVTVGWMGVNAVLMIADKFGLADIKAKQSPTVGALINAAVRVIATPFVAKLASRFLKMPMDKVAAGGAINVVLHGVQDLIAANPTVLPDAAKPLLLGYDGFADYVTIQGAASAPRMNGFISTRDIPGGMRGLGMTQYGRVSGRVLV